MFVKQLYTGCLSESAYYIESNGEAAIIDPLRDIDDYLEIASERKTTIKMFGGYHTHGRPASAVPMLHRLVMCAASG